MRLRRQSLLNRLLLYRTRDRLSIRPDDLHQEEIPRRVFLEPPIMPSNMSKDSFLYSTSGSCWP